MHQCVVSTEFEVKASQSISAFEVTTLWRYTNILIIIIIIINDSVPPRNTKPASEFEQCAFRNFWNMMVSTSVNGVVDY